MNNQTKQSHGDLKTQLNFIIFPEEGECHPACIDKTPYKTFYVIIYHLCLISYNINVYWSIDLDNKDENGV